MKERTDKKLETHIEQKIIISDMDEVLVNIVPKTIEIIQSKKEIFQDYLNIFNLSITDIFNREHYYIEQWLKKDNIEIPHTINDEIMNIWKDVNFYNDLKPTVFCKALNEGLFTDKIKYLYIVSKVTCDEQIESKLKWIMNNFNKSILSKIDFVPVKLNEKKSDIINNLNIEWDSYAEDDISNIIDVVTNSKHNCFGNEILIPRMGYNKPTNDFCKITERLNLQVYYM